MIFTDRFHDLSMITWNIIDSCNFRCDYCNNIRAVNKNDREGLDFSLLKKGFDSLGKDWIIHITGGEPFLSKNILAICEMITQNHYISLNTNLSTQNVYDFADTIDPKKVLFISSSVHILERERRDPSLSKYTEKIRYLQEREFNIIASYVNFPTLLHRIRNDFETLKAGGVNKVRMKTFRGSYDRKNYPASFSVEERSIISELETDYPEKVIMSGEYSSFGLKCGAGSRFFVMDKSGNLKRCSALNRKYGNLLNGSFKPDLESRPCPLKYCGCPYEGIRNISMVESSKALLYKELSSELFYKFKDVLNNPRVLLKLGDKIREF